MSLLEELSGLKTHGISRRPSDRRRMVEYWDAALRRGKAEHGYSTFDVLVFEMGIAVPWKRGTTWPWRLWYRIQRFFERCGIL